MRTSKVNPFIVTVTAIAIAGGIVISMPPGLHRGWEYWCIPTLIRFNVLLNFKLKQNTTQLSEATLEPQIIIQIFNV